MNPRRQPSSIDRLALAADPVVPDLRGLTSPDGAITLMLGDIAQAPTQAQRLGADRWQQVLSEHQALVREVVGEHSGHVARFEDDGFYAAFLSAHASLQAAVDLQHAFAARVGNGDDTVLALRIGLHAGFVMVSPDEPKGRNAVLAARIATHAADGEILVSDALKRYTERDRRFEFEPRGEHHFKGLLGEHTLHAVRWREFAARD